MAASCGDADVLERDVLDGTTGFSPDDGRHLAALEVGVTVCGRDIFEGDVSDGPALVGAFGDAGDVGEFHEDGNEGLLHPDIRVVDTVDDAAVIPCVRLWA